MQQATHAIENAIALMQKTADSPQRLTVWAQAVDVKGSLQLAQGKAEDALLSWEQAKSLYQKLQDSNKVTLVQVNQAQALQSLGLYQRAISTLQNLKTTLQKQPDSLAKAANLRSLGDALLLAGDRKQAKVNLQASLKIAQQLQSPENIDVQFSFRESVEPVYRRLVDLLLQSPESKEVTEIKNTGVDVSIIAEEQFTSQAFNKKLNTSNFDIVHLATHAYFGADRENTFVLTSDGTMKIDDFDQLFQRQGQKRTQSIEILFLSACQTATGNDQAIMGIAGTTVQAGASSAIASLWDLDDESSVIFTKAFYQQVGQPNVSRAEALRLAQQALLQDPNYDHPRFWAPYVLVGSWL